jgi:hypothetical protein
MSCTEGQKVFCVLGLRSQVCTGRHLDASCTDEARQPIQLASPTQVVATHLLSPPYHHQNFCESRLEVEAISYYWRRVLGLCTNTQDTPAVRWARPCQHDRSSQNPPSVEVCKDTLGTVPEPLRRYLQHMIAPKSTRGHLLALLTGKRSSKPLPLRRKVKKTIWNGGYASTFHYSLPFSRSLLSLTSHLLSHLLFIATKAHEGAFVRIR